MAEAAAQYSHALELLAEMPESGKRDQEELAVQISLGLALWGAKAWASSGIPSRLHARTRISGEAGRERSANVDSIRAFAERIVQLAESGEQRGFLSAGHAALGYSLLVGGKPQQAQRHLDLARSYLDESDPRPLVKESSIILLMSPMLVVLALGFPDRARRLADEAVRHAEGIGPYVEGIVRVHAAVLYLRLRDPQHILENANALSRIAKENPAFTGQANEFTGQGLWMQGKRREAMEVMAQARSYNEAAGMRITRARELNFEARFLAHNDRTDEALAKVEEALQESEELGADRPSTLRLRGDLLVQREAQASQVKSAYQQAITCARDLENKWEELQTMAHFARWLKNQGRRDEARTMLAAIYNWFTEGFDTADLKDTKTLLHELSQ
jgi:tetratricopeptide (TPR) repeat protein